MEKGYVQGGRGTFWTKTEKKIPTLPQISKDTLMLTGEIIGEDSIVAYKCENCRKIIIDY